MTAAETCPYCGHHPHHGRLCRGWTECSDHASGHACACSHPDPGNHIRVPRRRLRGLIRVLVRR